MASAARRLTPVRSVAVRHGRRALGLPPIVRSVRTGRAELALTFDDGPAPWTAAIAAALERHGCRGTFFVRGAAVAADPGTVAALAAAGHDVGNHLHSHRDAADLSLRAIRAELRAAGRAVAGVTGTSPALVRPPYCSAPRRVARAAVGAGVRAIVLRSIDPADWRAPSGDAIAAAVLAQAGPGEIVCLHDGIAPGNSGTSTRAATVEAVERLVPALLARGLRPVTCSELLA
jgi:peptidoglycan/xylan/chitin deacetylase (PgdA/CDA1 family)